MKNFISLISIVSLSIFIFGCEPTSNSNNSDPYVDRFNIYGTISYERMFKGQEASVICRVNTCEIYEFYIITYNDGAADRISVYVDGIKVGSYTVPQKDMWGSGWYNKPYNSPKYRFSVTNELVTITVHVDSADSYGTWPKTLEGHKVSTTNNV